MQDPSQHMTPSMCNQALHFRIGARPDHPLHSLASWSRYPMFGVVSRTVTRMRPSQDHADHGRGNTSVAKRKCNQGSGHETGPHGGFIVPDAARTQRSGSGHLEYALLRHDTQQLHVQPRALLTQNQVTDFKTRLKEQKAKGKKRPHDSR